MHIPSTGLIRDSGPHFDQTLDQPLGVAVRVTCHLHSLYVKPQKSRISSGEPKFSGPR
jgi:hypothetical protein